MNIIQVYIVERYTKLSQVYYAFHKRFFTEIIEHNLLELSRVCNDSIEHGREDEFIQDYYRLIELFQTVLPYHIEINFINDFYFLHIYDLNYWREVICK